MHNKKRGVYFLANDGVFDLSVAFLNSFRAHNPEIPLCMIPFNESIHRLEALQYKYNFTIFRDNALYKACDELSTLFHNKVFGHYRKLAIWEGGFDEFIYIDVDTIILRNIEYVFGFLSDYEFITFTSNYKPGLKWVWKKSIYKTGLLTPSQIAYAANTGFICSKKGALALECISGKVESVYFLKQHIALCGIEQTLLNYLIITSGKRYTSLQVLSSGKSLFQGGLNCWWAGWKNAKIQNGQLFLDSIPILLIHWAGLWQPGMLERIVSRIMKILHIKNKDEHSKMRFFMPYKRLWRHYRFMQN